MAYYLIISFIFFVFIDYKYIYSYIDSKILYTTSGSKLKAETFEEKRTIKNFNCDKADMFVLLISFLVLFSLNYTIATLAFNTNPLIIKIINPINVKEIIQGYETNIRITYHISAALCIVFVIFKYRSKLRGVLAKFIKRIIKQETIYDVEQDKGYIIAKDINDECFYIDDNALYQNVLITGSIGSGKTSGAVARIMYNLLKSGKGGVVLDIKGNFVDTVNEMCRRMGRTKDVCVLSQNSNYYIELLDNNISSLELANRLKQIITLLSSNNTSDSYWLDKVENVLMNLIIIMKYLGEMNLMLLHRLVSEEAFLRETIASIKTKIKENVPDDKTAFELAGALSFIDNELLKLDNRVSTIIKSEITRLTIPLVTDYDIYNQFCVRNNKKIVSFEDNKIIILSINVGNNKALAKIIATFIKLSYQKYILSNINSNNPSFFIADEYQEFCNSDDAAFLSLSREAKCINIISTQSYSSIKNTLKDQNAANVIIQNLVNKIWFRNDDNYTISEIVKQLGKTNVIKENKTISESGQESKKNLLHSGFKNKKSSISKSLNYIVTKENEYDENFFSRELKNFESLAFISTKEGIVIKKIIFERWK